MRKTPLKPGGPIKAKRRTPEEVQEARRKKAADKRARKKAGMPSANDLIEQADELAGVYCRSVGRCEAEGHSGMKCGGQLQWAHIKSRAHKYIRHDPLNFMCLCVRCHQTFTMNPDLWVRAVEAIRPGTWGRLNALLIEQKERRLKPDYEYWIDFYTRNPVRHL